MAEHLLGGRGRGGGVAVDGNDPPATGEVDDHAAAVPGDSVVQRLDHPLGEGGRNRGVDGVSPGPEHRHAGTGGLGMGAGNGPEPSSSLCHFLTLSLLQQLV